MLKFFRRIRQELIGGGNLTSRQAGLKKYLIYAIGEIILVMIGILLALQVNNWNENRKLRKNEQSILMALKEEYNYNLEVLNEKIELLEKSEFGMKKALTHTGPDYDKISEEAFSNLLSDVSRDYIHYSPSIGAIQDLLNSGNLNTISDAFLRRRLAAWEGRLQDLSLQESVVESYREQVKQMSIENGKMVNLHFKAGRFELHKFDIDPDKFEIDPRQMLNNIKFENLIMYKIASSSSLKRKYFYLREEIEQTLELIERNIK